MADRAPRSSGRPRSRSQRTALVCVAQVLMCILMIGCGSVFAADLSLAPNSELGNRQATVILRGPIKEGDAKRLEAFFRQRVPTNWPGITDYWRNVAVSLDSPGGDFAEGLQIANFVHNAGIGTLVQSGNTCASACALAFLGGSIVGEDGGVDIDRSLEVGGRLQFHAPYVDTGTVTTDRAELVRRLTDVNIELLQSITTTFGVPPSMVQTLLRNDDKHSLYTVSAIQTLVALQVGIEDLYQPETLTLEMATNLCLNSNAAMDDSYGNIESALKEALRVQATKKIMRMPRNDNGDDVAIPIAVSGAEEYEGGYCIVRRSKEDESFDCSNATMAASFEKIKSVRDLRYGENCARKAFPPELFLVPVETKLQDYESVVRKMEMRGKSIFDASLLTEQAVKSPSKSTARGFICNDQAEFANMREGPHSKNFAVVAELANNSSVKILEETSNSETGHPWLKISARGKEGFVDKDLVSTEKCAQSVAAAVEPVADFKPGKAVICNSEASFANMRSGPGPQNDVMMALDNKTPVKKLAAAVNEETQHPWLKIQAKGRTGYVDAEKVAAGCP